MSFIMCSSDTHVSVNGASICSCGAVSLQNTDLGRKSEPKTEPTGGTKHDSDKVMLELLSPIALNEIGRVLTYGSKKYAAHNWRGGFKWSRLLGAALRHLLAFMGGQDKDPETGISHIAHASCCLMFLLEHEVTHKDKDDRYVDSSKKQ